MLVIELFTSGSLNTFAKSTNVDIRNRIVSYDIKELGKQLKKLGMLIVQDKVSGRVTANRAEGRATRYYMDEFHLLLKRNRRGVLGGNLEAVPEVGRYTDRHHAELQRPAVLSRDREHL